MQHSCLYHRDSIGNSTKNAVNTIKTNIENRNREAERKPYNPLFAEDISDSIFIMSKLIHVTEMDKKRAASAVCQGSIGYISESNDVKVVNIFKDHINRFGITLFPDNDSSLYYVDPCDPSLYIALNDYFSHLKIVRVNELQKIAQDLGAKHFRVTYRDLSSSSSDSSASVKLGATIKKIGNTNEVSRQTFAAQANAVEVAAEMDCPGHEPCEPTLCYLQKDPSIQSLITLRMDPASPLSHQKYTLQLSNSSGIKAYDAKKLDTAIRALKLSAGTTVESEVHKESQRFFEYEIDF